jgi:hypothetical protein
MKTSDESSHSGDAPMGITRTGYLLAVILWFAGVYLLLESLGWQALAGVLLLIWANNVFVIVRLSSQP